MIVIRPRRLTALVACEFSAVVRDALREAGHDAWSADFEETEGDPRWHIVGDVRRVLGRRWDLLIAHPPCRYLSLAGVRWEKERPEREQLRMRAARFAVSLAVGPLVDHIPHRLLEQPQSRLSTMWRKPDQVIQPWQFGHRKSKAHWLWLRGLPLLTATRVVGPPPRRMSLAQRKAWNEVHHEQPGPEREKNRSRTYPGIAAAMALQFTAALA